jgi:hypothetical protein
MSSSKQAVVLIHGIGEQVPMDTLRGFVEAVWTSDKTAHHPYAASGVWSKPDKISGNYELRRMTTTKNREGTKTDFFEFYWAHLMKETKFSHVSAWVRVLLLRWPGKIPSQLRGVWWMLVMLLFLALLVGLNAAFKWVAIPPSLLKVASASWLILGSFLIGLLLNVAGDAARYLHVAPPNIEIRRNIRQAGINLLGRLHASKQYDRIIVVGHSLGSVIGYDILTHLWARYNYGRSKGAEKQTPALDELEGMVNEYTPSNFDINKFQAAQSRYLAELKKQGNRWRISDFVTLGSPLAHAPFLTTRKPKDFELKKTEREFPTCPPELESYSSHNSVKKKFTFEEPKGSKIWIPHHAAVFGPTRWTNLYFPCRSTIRGDLIGGPLARNFGFGVRDIPVDTTLRRGFLSHTLYWRFPRKKKDAVPSWIKNLREAVRICDGPDPTLPPPTDTVAQPTVTSG